MAKAKRKSRVDRWNEAVTSAKERLEELRSALGELQDVHSEYVDWKENLPENLAESALGAKLEAVAEFEVEDSLSTLDELESSLDEWESADLPLGFGRD